MNIHGETEDRWRITAVNKTTGDVRQFDLTGERDDAVAQAGGLLYGMKWNLGDISIELVSQLN